VSKKSKRHTHKYHKVLVAGDPVWACALPDCSHYMPNHMSELVPGRASLCWNCGEKFILDNTNMRETNQPTCINCYRATDWTSNIEEFISNKVAE